MQSHWLNKQNNDKLIIFFAGWSFDYKPFEFLDCEDFDVLIIYDYNTPTSKSKISVLPSREDIEKYPQKYLIAWSMGVFMAYQMREQLPQFKKKLAVNGTPFPVDDEFGIPQKPFLLTLRHAKTGLEGKFYQNIFEKPEEFERYQATPVERSIENREQELKTLYAKIKETEILKQVQDDKFSTYYDKALVSNNDKIIPTKNQLNFWQNKVPVEILESGHFPYYNFKSWNEILCK